MFKALEPGSTIGEAPSELVTMLRSTNTQRMPFGGAPTPLRAFSAAFRSPATGRYRIYVFLARADAAGGPDGLLFTSDEEGVDRDRFRELQREAGVMVNEQGFQMEALDWPALPPQDKVVLLEQLPFPAGTPLAPPPVSRSEEVTAPGGHPITRQSDSGMIPAGRLRSADSDAQAASARDALTQLLSLF